MKYATEKYWQNCKDRFDDVELALRHEINIRKGSLVWDAIGHKARKRHDKHLQNLDKVRSKWEDVIEQYTCDGCGEFVDNWDDSAPLHDDRYCIGASRQSFKESCDPRV